MPRGKKFVNHKGRSRYFTSPEELQQESEENSDEETGSNDSENNDADNGAGSSKASTSKTASSSTNEGRHKQTSIQRKAPRGISSEDESENDDDSDDDDDDRGAKKGVASLIEIENPNRAIKKSTQKMSNLTLEEPNTKPDLTRREREQIEKQKARRKYEKLHAAGKTREAKSDLARLALIRQQREEAAAKREAEKKAQESQKA